MHQALRAALILWVLPSSALAVQLCELGGQPVNPSNGHTTAGKTGLMRCRDADSGRLAREQELRNGVFMGLVRHYREGVLQQEYQVNERGNRDGVSREFAATAAGQNPLLAEETQRNGSTVGASRRWHANGRLKRVGFHDDEGREQAVAAFTPRGQLSELRCAPQALLAPHVDDAKLCGHQGGQPATVALHDDDGGVRARLTHERGERRVYELLWDNGRLREQKEFADTGATSAVSRSTASSVGNCSGSRWPTGRAPSASRRWTRSSTRPASWCASAAGAPPRAAASCSWKTPGTSTVSPRASTSI